MNKKKKVNVLDKNRRKTILKRYLMTAVACAVVGVVMFPVLADSEAETAINNMSDIIFGIIRAVGVILAFAFRDNRAFCKYVCPITVFLKPMSYYSRLRVTCDKEKCVSCGKCARVCPMDVDVTDNSRARKNGTECILCMECVKHCPKNAL